MALRAKYTFNGSLTTDNTGNWYTLTNTNSVGTGKMYWDCADFTSANTNKSFNFSSTTPFWLTRNWAQSYFFANQRYAEIWVWWFESMIWIRFQVSGSDCQTYWIYYDYNWWTRRVRYDAAWRANQVFYKTATLWTWRHTFWLKYAGWWDTALVTGYLDWIPVVSWNQTSGSTNSGSQWFWLWSNTTIQFNSAKTDEVEVHNIALPDSFFKNKDMYLRGFI